MKYLLFILVITILNCENLLAQKDSSSPLAITIKIEKEYELKFPKEHFSYEVGRSSLNITSDSVIQKHFDIEVKLKNNSTEPIFIWLMSCSWDDNFLINNNYMYFRVEGCDKNIPVLIKINQGESKTYKSTLSKSIKFEYPCKNCLYGPQVETTKLGLVLIDDIFQPKLDGLFGYDLAMEDKSLWRIIWSNPLHLLR